ncbi:MAG: hypothetical protein ACJ746_16940 [Bryobacteraceae bacterium]
MSHGLGQVRSIDYLAAPHHAKQVLLRHNPTWLLGKEGQYVESPLGQTSDPSLNRQFTRV